MSTPAVAAGDDTVAAHTRRWVEQFVIALDLCPFAAPVLRDGGLRIAVCADAGEPALVRFVLTELDLLQAADETEIATSLLVFPAALKDFDAYLDFLDLAQSLLEECGLEGVVQIASFHPDYRFADVAADAAGNYTNRAPYPMLHLLREAALSRVLAHYPQPERIPQRNIERLDGLGRDAIKALLQRIGRRP